MLLSQKSINFAKKILKYNPKSEGLNSSCHDNCSSHDQSQKCSKTNKNDQKCASDIKPYLHVHDYRKQRQIYQKPTKQKIQNMQLFKQQGNQHYQNKRYQQAAYSYNKLIIYSDYTFPSGQQQIIFDELVQQGTCNLAQTLMKLGQPKQSQQKFKQAIKGPVEKLKRKSLYWLAKLAADNGDIQNAREYISTLRNQPDTQNECIQLDTYIKSVSTKSTIYTNMFTK